MSATPAVMLPIFLCFSFVCLSGALNVDYYKNSCPNVEEIVTQAVTNALKIDKAAAAGLLRLHFHDCFVRGCDGSVLLDSAGSMIAEKDGQPNLSLHGFYIIDNAKRDVEASCPGIVSCADILALAARDVVVFSGGPYWDVPKGRKDGCHSLAIETQQLPSPTFNLSQLVQSFSKRGLSEADVVALSGAHTLGFAHCSSFENRLYNFDKEHDIDPTLDVATAQHLREQCPLHNKKKNGGSPTDLTSTTFDNTYYKQLLQGRGLFSSDQALLSTPQTQKLVREFATSRQAFFEAFAQSIIKMGELDGGEEVRRECRKVN